MVLLLFVLREVPFLLLPVFVCMCACARKPACDCVCVCVCVCARVCECDFWCYDVIHLAGIKVESWLLELLHTNWS